MQLASFMQLETELTQALETYFFNLFLIFVLLTMEYGAN
uniref:Uncharacterized protein n=1 Tax=Arundo donax TaxID=35708 RepID=A0A0A9AHT6_ARUDO